MTGWVSAGEPMGNAALQSLGPEERSGRSRGGDWQGCISAASHSRREAAGPGLGGWGKLGLLPPEDDQQLGHKARRVESEREAARASPPSFTRPS